MGLVGASPGEGLLVGVVVGTVVPTTQLCVGLASIGRVPVGTLVGVGCGMPIVCMDALDALDALISIVGGVQGRRREREWLNRGYVIAGDVMVGGLPGGGDVRRQRDEGVVVDVELGREGVLLTG